MEASENPSGANEAGAAASDDASTSQAANDNVAAGDVGSEAAGASGGERSPQDAAISAVEGKAPVAVNDNVGTAGGDVFEDTAHNGLMKSTATPVLESQSPVEAEPPTLDAPAAAPPGEPPDEPPDEPGHANDNVAIPEATNDNDSPPAKASWDLAEAGKMLGEILGEAMGSVVPALEGVPGAELAGKVILMLTSPLERAKVEAAATSSLKEMRGRIASWLDALK
jgi:hypothetical protein